MKPVVYKEWCGIAKDTIKLPAGPTFRDSSDDESPMETAGSDGWFSDGDGEVTPQKRTKLLSATELFPPTGNAKNHPPASTKVENDPNDHTPVKLNLDPEKAPHKSPLYAMFDSTNGPKSFKVKLLQGGAEFLPPQKNLIPSSNVSKAHPKLPSPQTPAKKAPLLPPMIHPDGTWECCSIEYLEKRLWCTNCFRWKDKRSKMSTKAKGERKTKSTANHATEASAAVIAKLAADLLPANVSTDRVDMSLGKNLSPLTAHLGLVAPNPKSMPPKNNNEIDADDDDGSDSVGTFNTLTLPINKIQRILKYLSRW
jgi:hypothetical protein